MPKKRRSPAKGTKSRQVLLMMLRPQGVTVNEMKQVTDWNDTSIHTFFGRMLDSYGLDIRSFPICETEKSRFGGNVSYRLIGKIIARGKYRSFV